MPNLSGDDDAENALLSLRQGRSIAEAARVAELLQQMVRRAGVEEVVRAGEVADQLNTLERAHLMREVGQISGRNRFKRRVGSGNPVRDQRVLRSIFADESGLPRLSSSSSDNAFRWRQS